MADHCVFGRKAYKSIIRRWFRRKKSASSSQDNPQRGNQTQQEPVDENKAGTTRNGIHRRIENCFPSMVSLSKNASRRNQTRSKSCKTSCESMPSHSSSWNRSGSLRSVPPDLQSRNLSRRFSTPIMFSNSSGMLKPLPIEKNIECTLEELCYGCKKDINITREVLTDAGGIVQEEELLSINVQPGWKKGTMITFEGKGNERPEAYREDIAFFICEEKHQLFRREGDDLELGVEIPLVKALTGGTISVPLLGGEQMSLTVEDIIYPGYEKIITGQGMPISTIPGKRGNLIIKFLVEFPTQLSDNQRSEVVGILQDSC